ncbi:unnamed protein product [Acanthoscelides obtectus]|uniref:DDE Tnp4 domain-containing protein n=1 Tax=Acanthoscelides obtectus TaxID=200917 RepID=A0A9P0LYV8_ACAOB|nr:unnamed protein product [Acanthoscelides obtectus]CAK1648543.1 Protein ALP1-like [Acanthoscelides obtectus]
MKRAEHNVYFATGCNLKALSCYFLRGHTTIREIIARTSVVIWKVLQPTYLPNPIKETWVQSARRYWELWNLPNCVGSIDGKHIRIKRPPKSGSEFINYKGYFSIVLMAVSDADGCFLTIDVGAYGRNSDGRALRESNFGKKLVNSTLDLPDPSPLPGQDTNFPFYFAADEAFPLMCTIMKPYPKRGLTNRKWVFNGRLSRGRKSVECSFGMMSSKFRILHTTIGLNINTVDNIVKAVCLLHNFIEKEEGIFSRPRGKKGNDDDIEVENEEQPYPRLSNQRRATNPAIARREKLCDFFLTVDGSLKGQKRFCV